MRLTPARILLTLLLILAMLSFFLFFDSKENTVEDSELTATQAAPAMIFQVDDKQNLPTTTTTTTIPPTTTTHYHPPTTIPPPPQTTVAPPPPTPQSSSVNWDAIAQCESGGNWYINTGNGYYGGLQFDLQTWQSVGGTGYPHEHSREEQIHRAEILYSQRGVAPWPTCGRYG